MTVFSFMRRSIDLEPVEVEIGFAPGLPKFEIIGLPDASIKESLLRVRSALRQQGFLLPQKDQVIINLKPAYEKKLSQGMDLAIAIAYLIKTGQIEIETQDKNIYCYGELSLDGQVTAPSDLGLLEKTPDNGPLLTGPVAGPCSLHRGEITDLKSIQQIQWQEPTPHSDSLEGYTHTDEVPTYLRDYRFHSTTAETLAVVAAGEHNTFVAGPAGTGKSTFCFALHQLLRPPTQEEWKKMIKIAKLTGKACRGRPYMAPHHSSSEIALLGGGNPPYPGEITRAQHGLLILDEFLEFSSTVKESLREPIERHEITISRFGKKTTFPADFLLIGTSNLCPCGDYVPGLNTKCGYFSSHCKSYYRKLTGPLLDRFEIISFSHSWRGEKLHSIEQIHNRAAQAQKFALENRGQIKMNSRLTLKECESLIDPFTKDHLLPEAPASQRRLLALLRVARTIADLDAEPKVMGHHLNQAKDLTIQPFRAMKEAWY